MKNDKTAVSDEIESVLNGTSMVNMAEKLNISTDGCERLQKEYKRLSR